MVLLFNILDELRQRFEDRRDQGNFRRPKRDKWPSCRSLANFKWGQHSRCTPETGGFGNYPQQNQTVCRFADDKCISLQKFHNKKGGEDSGGKMIPYRDLQIMKSHRLNKAFFLTDRSHGNTLPTFFFVFFALGSRLIFLPLYSF